MENKRIEASQEGDTISRQAAIDALGERPLVWDEWADEYSLGQRNQYDADKSAIEALPPAQPEDWMERNKERILQAGMEGREIEFRIGGRLFAIREKAQ